MGSDSDLDLPGKLRERIKELNFLHHTARLLNMRGEPRDILAAVLDLLPGACRYPDIATAHVSFGELDVQTRGHVATAWCMRSEFESKIGTPRGGFIEICYARAPSAEGADPFLSEERALLGSCSELLQSYFERLSADAALQKLTEGEAARRAAEEAIRMKDEFLGNVAHELRASLHVMQGWVQILRQGPDDRELGTRALTILERNVLLQAKLIEDLLDLSRITSGKLTLDMTWVNFEELVGYAVEAIRPGAEAKSIRLISNLEPVGDVWADQQRLQQVFYNILGNAVKFTPAGGSIEITLRNAGSHAEVNVKDSGAGIDPVLLPHIFERFRQAGVPPGRRGGLGLGLAIADHLVQRHHGTITVASDGPGKGAAFRVLLPLRPGE
jgi:signal transduction histidine kinase